jgi:hypothetical protein
VLEHELVSHYETTLYEERYLKFITTLARTFNYKGSDIITKECDQLTLVLQLQDELHPNHPKDMQKALNVYKVVFTL